MNNSEFYCLLIHYDEIATKLGNRNWFEKKLTRNIKNQINDLKYSKVQRFAGRIFVNDIDYLKKDVYINRLKKVMGVSSAHVMLSIPASIDLIMKKSIDLLESYKNNFNTFKVLTKRQNKSFEKKSQEVNHDVGDLIRSTFDKQVKLKNPDLEFRIEIIDDLAFLGFEQVKGYGGLPVGTGESALSLISSGIDSPVASFKMLKRGVQLSYIHFHSAPATGEESIENVKKIIDKLSEFQSTKKLFLIPFLDIQKEIMSKAPNKFWVILFRRAMIKASSIIAKGIGAKALITGENVGQVASQTLSNILAISDTCDIPILRPLIGYNKKDIINLASDIETYEISTLPYDDCCSFFVPKHPETKANINVIKDCEKDININLDSLCKAALDQVKDI